MSVKLKGEAALLKKLSDVKQFQKWGTPPMRQIAAEFKKIEQVYPPRIPDQKYIRTMSYFRSVRYRVTRIAKGLRARVFSKIPYAGVLKVAPQGRYFQDRWTLAADDLKAYTDRAIKIVQDALDKELK